MCAWYPDCSSHSIQHNKKLVLLPAQYWVRVEMSNMVQYHYRHSRHVWEFHMQAASPCVGSESKYSVIPCSLISVKLRERNLRPDLFKNANLRIISVSARTFWVYPLKKAQHSCFTIHQPASVFKIALRKPTKLPKKLLITNMAYSMQRLEWVHLALFQRDERWQGLKVETRHANMPSVST